MKVLRSLPLSAYCLALAIAIACGLTVAVSSYGASEYARGRKSVTVTAEAITPAVIVARAADSTAKAATDTVVQRITVTRWKVDTLIRDVPDTLAAVPQIRSLIAATQTLTAQIDTLATTLNVERAVSRLRASTDSAALVSAALTIVHQEDQIVSLKRRPQWRTVALALGAGIVAGVLR